MKKLPAIIVLVCLSVLLVMFGCGGGSSDNTPGDGVGTLSISMIDSSTDLFKAIYVTIGEIQVHKADGGEDDADDTDGGVWIVVAAPHKTINLLNLVNGIKEQLTLTELEAGKYTQIRLILDKTPDDGTNILGNAHPYANYFIDGSDNEVELKVPSAYNSGIKIVGGIKVLEGETTEIILDFDASKSVVRTCDGKWILKPVIKFLRVEDAAILKGKVTDESDQPLSGVLVSLQKYHSDETDDKDKIELVALSITDTDGNYYLLAEEGEYNVVVYKKSYAVDCAIASLTKGNTEVLDFTLAAANEGEVTGAVTINDGTASIDCAPEDEPTALLGFRQTSACQQTSGDDQMIYVWAVLVANGGTYSVDLPEGTYTLVAYADGKETKIYDITVTAGGTTTQDVTFD